MTPRSPRTATAASNDPKADAAVKFAALVARERDHVGEEARQNVRRAGYSDPEPLEIAFHVALNTLTT
jgi:alkylhydroperoxidase family enzyme